jgi:uncharacterized membrane protein
MEWLLATMQFYCVLCVFSLIFFILLRPYTQHLYDNAYAFARPIGILVTTFIFLQLSFLKLLPFESGSLWLIIGSFGLYALYKVRNEPKLLHNIPYKHIAVQETLFIVCLFLWVFVRGQEPSIQSLEKFMDFGFIQSINRMERAPPLDMWLSGDTAKAQYAINYYYFGHLWTAIIIKMSGLDTSVGYNLILATILALSSAQVMSIVVNLIQAWANFSKKSVSFLQTYIFGLLGALLVNFAGNLHTIYLFTKGYEGEHPVPFWTIWAGILGQSNYWYPNATRFIPFTIHEFPLYSYVVADLHGHVLNIPFALTTIFGTILALIYVSDYYHKLKKQSSFASLEAWIYYYRYFFIWGALAGFLCGICYMTNAFDGAIYILLTLIAMALVGKNIKIFTASFLTTICSFFITTFFFNKHFIPFASGIGLNCSPNFLVKLHKLGPFLFEADKCQVSAPYMLFVLWGSFFIACIIFVIILFKQKIYNVVDTTILLLFGFCAFLIAIPEFFYIKDIYPAHFRANTMFKMGYQAFIIGYICFVFVIFRLKHIKVVFQNTQQLIARNILYKYLPLTILFSIILLVFLYPMQAINGYYGQLKKPISLQGDEWLKLTLPSDYEAIQFLQKNVKNQPVILEAQGDSYTNYGRMSAFTGLPTVLGWFVHEWLWRGSSDTPSKRASDVTTMYTSNNKDVVVELLKKYSVVYIVIGKLERDKYPTITDGILPNIATPIFTSSNDPTTTIYKVNN